MMGFYEHARTSIVVALLALTPGCGGCRGMVPMRAAPPLCEAIASARPGGALAEGGSGAAFAHDATLRGFSVRQLGADTENCTRARAFPTLDHEEVAVELLHLPPGDYELSALDFDDPASAEGHETASHGDLPLRFTVAPAAVTVLGDVACIRPAATERCTVTVAALGRGHDIVVRTIKQRAANANGPATFYATWAARL